MSFHKSSLLCGVSLGVLLLAAPADVVTPAVAQPVQLGPVTVQDNSEKNGLNHAPATNVLPTESLQDMPQAVTVVSGELMKEQGTTTLQDALRNVPGITIAIGEGGTLAGDQFKIRGFDAKDDVYLDGLRDFAAYTRDAFNYEEVQVLKGPSGLMFGRGTTGGAINTVSKTPMLRDRFALVAEGGNGDHKRATADLNYQLSDTAAVRLNLMYTDTGVVDRDFAHSTRWGTAPTIALGLGTDTQWSLSYLHQHTDAHPDYGLVVAQRPGQLIAEPVSEYGVPRNTNTQFNSDIDRNDADIVTMKIDHQATPWLTLENDTRGAWYSRTFQYTTVDTCEFAIPPGTQTSANATSTNYCSAIIFGQATPTSAVGTADPKTALGQIGGGGPYLQQSWGVQDVATAHADFHIGDMRNVIVAGFDVGYQNADRTIYAYHLPTTAQFTYLLGDHTVNRRNIGINLYNPTHIAPPGYTVFLPTASTITNSNSTATTVVTSSGKATDLALFATDRFYVTPEISVIAGVRVDRYTATYLSTLVNGTSSTAKSPNTLVNPRAALVWEPSQDQTYYFSWGKSAVPQGTSVVGSPTPLTTANQALDPEKSETLEVGAKKSFFDGVLGLSGSLFTVRKSNALIVDPTSGAATAQSGERDRVRGLELSATGQITPLWNVTAAYTFLDSKVTSDNFCNTTTLVCAPNPYTIGTQVIFVPKNAGSVWTSYKMDEFLPGLGLGGGIVYQSKLFVRNTTAGTAPVATGLSRIAIIPQTFELDSVATYDFDKWHVQLNVNNITDALNYSPSFGNRGTPAPGRNCVVSVGVNL